MTKHLTIYQTFKTMELAEQQRMDDCAAQIKEIQNASPEIIVNPPQRGPSGAGNVAKYSPGGELIGWYHEGQKAGLPNRLMPIEQEMESQYQLYKKSVIDAFPVTITASILGELSGEARKERGHYQDIMNLHQELTSNGTPKHHRAKLIAAMLNCSVEYVRRTLRQINNTK
jgi:hypothetical protein